MIVQLEAVPYAHRREPNGTWTVFDTQSGNAAKLGNQSSVNLTEVDACELAAIFNRNTIGSASRLHRYAIQGLPGSVANPMNQG